MAHPIPFNRHLEFEYGVLQPVAPGIRRVVAHNPSPFTFYGTGTYVIGEGQVAVIDPGPEDPEHIQAILAGLEPGETITHILITHTHIDHSPGARLLQKQIDAAAYGFGPHKTYPDSPMGLGDEGGDLEFQPDRVVGHGDMIAGDGWTMECVHTPGHISNHLCFAFKEQQALFTGDMVMGWSTSVIIPPDGSLSAYMDSLDLLLSRDDQVYWPTHGDCIKDVKEYVGLLKQHRYEREDELVTCLKQGMDKITDIVEYIYRDYPANLHRPAAWSIYAHMLHLLEKGQVICEGEGHMNDAYYLKN